MKSLKGFTKSLGDWEDSDLSNLEPSEFNSNSTKVEILSGSVKTGSFQIKDSEQINQNCYPFSSFDDKLTDKQEKIHETNNLWNKLAVHFQGEQSRPFYNH